MTLETYIVSIAVNKDLVSTEDLQDRMQMGLNTLDKDTPLITGITDTENTLNLFISPSKVLCNLLPNDYCSQISEGDLGKLCEAIRDKYKDDIHDLEQKIKSEILSTVAETFPEREFVDGGQAGIYHGQIRKHDNPDNDKNEIRAQRYFIDEVLIKQLISNVRSNTKQEERFKEIDNIILSEDLFNALNNIFRQYGIFIWDPYPKDETEMENHD